MLNKEDKKYIEDRIEGKIDNLAILIQNGFKQIMETKADKDDMDVRFKLIDERFDNIDRRFDVLEYKIVGGQERRLEKVEDDVRILKTKLNLN